MKLTKPQVMKRLRAECAQWGNLSAFARDAGLSHSFVSNVLAGRREPSQTLLSAIGIKKSVKRVVTYTAAALASQGSKP